MKTKIKLDTQKFTPYIHYIKFFGIWLVYYVVIGIISVLISSKAAATPESAEKYMSSATAIVLSILMILPNVFFVAAGLISLVKMGIEKLAKKDTTKSKKVATYSFLFLVVTYLLGGIYFKAFPDKVVNYFNEINIENNKLKNEANISEEELKQIDEAIKNDKNEFPVMKTANVDCKAIKDEYKKQTKTTTSTESAQLSDDQQLFKNIAENCNDGDIEVISGRTAFYGKKINQGYQKYYLMRKTDNKWQIVKTLLEKKWFE